MTVKPMTNGRARLSLLMLLATLPLGSCAYGPSNSVGKQVRTRLVEWIGDGLPHRTRVFVEVRPDAGNAANMRLRVTALMIESEPNFEEAREGVPIQYDWKLVGKNERVEEVVADQIMRRYLALREGKPLPLEEEMILPGRESGSG